MHDLTNVKIEDVATLFDPLLPEATYTQLLEQNLIYYGKPNPDTPPPPVGGKRLVYRDGSQHVEEVYASRMTVECINIDRCNGELVSVPLSSMVTAVAEIFPTWISDMFEWFSKLCSIERPPSRT